MNQLGFEAIVVPEQGGDFVATPDGVTDILFHYAAPPLSFSDPCAGGGSGDGEGWSRREA